MGLDSGKLSWPDLRMTLVAISGRVEDTKAEIKVKGGLFDEK